MHRLALLLTIVIAAGPGTADAQGRRFGGGGGGGGPDEDTSLLGRVRASAVEGVPAIQGVVVTQAVPETGHNSSHHPSGYNIWAVNCHTQANSFVAQATARGVAAGILACDGEAEQSPQHHTANWSLIGDGMTCVYNWGSSCCWQGDSSPPDTSSGLANNCARWACGDQYKADKSFAMPAGKLIEAPGPQACAISAAGGPANMMPGTAVTALTERMRTKSETVDVPASDQLPGGVTLNFSPDRMDSCLRCCEERASLWSGVEGASVTDNLAKGRESQFRRQCASACRASFSPQPEK